MSCLLEDALLQSSALIQRSSSAYTIQLPAPAQDYRTGIVIPPPQHPRGPQMGSVALSLTIAASHLIVADGKMLEEGENAGLRHPCPAFGQRPEMQNQQQSSAGATSPALSSATHTHTHIGCSDVFSYWPATVASCWSCLTRSTGGAFCSMLS